MHPYINFIVFIYELYFDIINSLPDVKPLSPPEGFTKGLSNIFKLIGFIMPYDLYKPLIDFILALTAFRIAWAVFVTFKRS